MQLIHFGRERATELVSALVEGRDIPAPPHGWNTLELINAAGACFFVALTHGPKRLTESGGYEPDTDATDQDWFDDLHAAIEFVSELAMKVTDGEYDSQWGSTVSAIVNGRGGARELKLLQEGELPEHPYEGEGT